ncbi:MAG: ABC transporter ATP-binding protein [Bacteroidota bacterium]
MTRLTAENLSKAYVSDNYIFRGISFEIPAGKALCVFGPNGSGKSTLLKLLAGAMQPNDGKIILNINDEIIPKEKRFSRIGFIAPYLNLYDEFTTIETARILAGMRGSEFSASRLEEFSETLGMTEYINKPIGEFSSGMKQRAKYLLAMIHSPELLLIDEPSTNLDEAGYSAVVGLIRSHLGSGGLLAIATNEKRDKELANQFIELKINKDKL